jgi:hypothetical protein
VTHHYFKSPKASVANQLVLMVVSDRYVQRSYDF